MTKSNASSLLAVTVFLAAHAARAEDAKPWTVERLDAYVAQCVLVPSACAEPDPQAADAARREVTRLYEAGDRQAFAAALEKYDFLLTPEQREQAKVARDRNASAKAADGETAASPEGPSLSEGVGDVRDSVGAGIAGLGPLFDNSKPGGEGGVTAASGVPAPVPAPGRRPAAARPPVYGTAVTPVGSGKGRKGFDFDTQELSAADAVGRPAAARRLAQTMLETAGGGKADPRRASALARFLEIAVKDRGAEDPLVRVQVAPTGTIQLFSPLSDGSLKVRSASFEEGTRWKGRRSGEALVVKEAGSYKDGVLTSDPRRRIELFPNGKALQWVDESSERGYGPFSRSSKTSATKLRLLERRADGGWKELGVEEKGTVTESAPGTSGVERLGKGIAEAPGVKQFLDVAHWAGGGIKRGVGLTGFSVGAVESKVGEWTGFQWLKDAGARSELEGLAANENGKHLEPAEFVKRSAVVYNGFNDDQRRQWDDEVYQTREEQLKPLRERLGEKTYNDLVYRKIEDSDRAVALAERLGMGNNGAYVARLASESSGFTRGALTMTGGVLTIAESAAESAPMILMSAGTGAAVKGLAGTRFASAAAAGHRTFHAANTALMGTGAVGNTMTLVEGLSEDDPRKVAAGSQAVLDMMFMAKSAGELKKWFDDRRTLDRRMTLAANGWSEPAPPSASVVPADVRRRMDSYVPSAATRTPEQLRASLSAPATPFPQGNKLPKTPGPDDAALRMVESLREEQHAVETVRGRLEGLGLKLPKAEEDKIREVVRGLQAANSVYDGYHGRRHQVGRNSVANMAFANLDVQRPAGMSDAVFVKTLVESYVGAAEHDYDLAVTQTSNGVTTVKGAPATDPVRVNRRFKIVERPEGVSDADLRSAFKRAAKKGQINADENPEGTVDVRGKSVRYRYDFDELPHGLKLTPPEGVSPEAAKSAAAGAYRLGGLLSARGTIKTKVDGKDVEIPYENPDASPGRYSKTDISRLGEPLFTMEKPSGGTESFYPKAVDTRSDVGKTLWLQGVRDPKADPVRTRIKLETGFSVEELALKERLMPGNLEKIRRVHGADADRIIALVEQIAKQVHKADFLNHYVQRSRLTNGHERSALFDGESLGKEFKHPFVNKEGSFIFMKMMAEGYATYMAERATPEQRQALMRNWVDMKLVAGRKDLVGADMDHLNRQLNENPNVRNLYEVADRLAKDNVGLQDAWEKISTLNIDEARLTARPEK